MQELQAAIQAAIDKQKSSIDEIKKLEKDIDEFKNNKEGKIDELKVRSREYASLRLLFTYNHFRLRSRS